MMPLTDRQVVENAVRKLLAAVEERDALTARAEKMRARLRDLHEDGDAHRRLAPQVEAQGHTAWRAEQSVDDFRAALIDAALYCHHCESIQCEADPARTEEESEG